MEIRPIDPRDTSWEQDQAEFRVHLWDTVNIWSHEFQITDAEVEEVLAWARGRTLKPGWTYTAYVRVEGDHDRGLIRIAGVRGDPFNPVQEQLMTTPQTPGPNQRLRCCICGTSTEAAEHYVLLELSSAEGRTRQFFAAHAEHLKSVFAPGFPLDAFLI